MLENLAE
jgi:hypothetical protein